MEIAGQLFGFIAALCISIYLIPQCYKIIKEKSSAGVSIFMVILAAVGDVSGVLHMLLIIDWDWLLFARQVLVGCVSTLLLILYFIYKTK